MMDEKKQVENRKAKKKALQLLERMDRTEKGLKEKMIQAGFSEEEVEDAVAYVKNCGYLNDRRYAENYIFTRIHQKSRQRIMQELYQKGIGHDVAAKAWKTIDELENPNERQILRSAVEKKYLPGSVLDEKEMRRLYGFLARRGFQAGDISSVIEEMNIKVSFRW